MTICSYDNSGQIKFDVDVEMEQGYWNTSSSRLWTKIRDWMHDDLVEIYKDLRQNGLSYETLMKYFYDEQIAKIPQTYYNNDCDVKYIPYANEYIGKAHGDGYEHLKRWLKRRIIFCDTLFDYSPSYTNDVLTIRANTTETMTLEIETYSPVYQHLSWYNNQMDKKKIDGKTSVTFTGKAQAATDQEVLIYGGSNIKSIKGISTMNPNQMLIGSATRLIELDARNCPLLTDINSNKANLSPHTYLNKVDLSGCSQLGGALRLNNSPLIRDVNMKGTVITSMQMPTSVRNLEVLRLPNTITSLTLQDASLLNTLEFDEGMALQSISLTNCNNLTNTINFDLTKTPTVYLDNSYNAEELYMSNTTNLTLRNMSNLERVIYTPNSEYESFDINNVINGSNYKVTTFNNPKMTTFMTTAPHRYSYGGEYKQFIEASEKVYTVSDMIEDNGINWQTGEHLANTGYCRLPYTEVYAGDTIKIDSTHIDMNNPSCWVILYDNNKVYKGAFSYNSCNTVGAYNTTNGEAVVLENGYMRIRMWDNDTDGKVYYTRQSRTVMTKDITPNTVFTANTLDLSDTQFTDIKFLCTTDLYNLKVPTTMKNFYCDSAMDIDTEVITDAGYEVIHDELVEPYTTDYSNEVYRYEERYVEGYSIPQSNWQEGYQLDNGQVTSQTVARVSDFFSVSPNTSFSAVSTGEAINKVPYTGVSFYDENKNHIQYNGICQAVTVPTNGRYARVSLSTRIAIDEFTISYTGIIPRTPNIIPSSASGSLIFNMYSNNTTQPTSTSPYMWDLTGLKLNDFYTYGMNNWVKASEDSYIPVNNNSALRKIQGTVGNSVSNGTIYADNSATTYAMKINLEVGTQYKIDTDVQYTPIHCYQYNQNSDGVQNHPGYAHNEDYYTTSFTPNKSTEYILQIPTSVIWFSLNGVRYYMDKIQTLELMDGTYNIDDYVEQVSHIQTSSLYSGSPTSITMPQRLPGYSVRMVNADITPNNYANHLYPLLVDTTLPITGRLDYSKYNGTSLAWAYAYTTNDVGITPLGSQNQSNITNDYNKLYGTDYVDIVDIWAYKDDDFSSKSVNEQITEAYIELTSDNYISRIDEVLQWYPNCHDIYLFDDGNVITLQYMYSAGGHNNGHGTRDQVQNITFMEGYFNNLDSLYNTFTICYNLVTVNNIPKSVTDFKGCFESCQKLNCQIDLSDYNISNGRLEGTFLNNYALSYTPILPSNYTGTMYATFRGCEKLVNPPIIPNSVTDMRNTFDGCKSLVNPPIIPYGVIEMYHTFYDCIALVSMGDIPDSVTNLNYTFYNCTSLRTIGTLSRNLTQLLGTFRGCRALEVAPSIPNGITNLEACFRDCSGITDWTNIINSPLSNVRNLTETFIGTSAPASIINNKTFTNCVFRGTFSSNLLETFITENVTLHNCTNFTRFINGSNVNKIVDLSGITSDSPMSFWEAFWGNYTTKPLERVIFPSCQVSNCTSLFGFLTNLTTVDMSNVDASTCVAWTTAFSNCSGLTTFNPPSNISASLDLSPCILLEETYVHQVVANLATVENATLTLGSTLGAYLSLTEIFLANKKGWTIEGTSNDYTIINANDDVSGLTTDENVLDCFIELTSTNYKTRIDEVLQWYPNCTNLYLFDDGSVSSLGNMFLNNNTNTKNQIVKVEFIDGYFSSLTNMGNTFNSCTSLTTVPNIPNSVTDMRNTFDGCTSLTTPPTIPDSVNNMYYTFQSCNSLTTPPTIPDGVTSMANTFYGCSKLTTPPNIPNSVTNMANTFNGCSSLTQVPSIPNSVTAINGTFNGCSKLTQAPNIPNGVTNLISTFQNCSSLTQTPTIPDGVTSMASAFYGCSKLTTVSNLPNSLIAMDNCFLGCSSLTTVPTIPSGVTNMTSTFSGCTSLTTSPTIPDGVTSMANTFYGCSKLTTPPNIPESVTNVSNCFYGCSSLINGAILHEGIGDTSYLYLSCTSLETVQYPLPNSNYGGYTVFQGSTGKIKEFTWIGERRTNFDVARLFDVMGRVDNNVKPKWIQDLVPEHLADLTENGTTATLTLGETYLSYLTEEEIEQAVNKGWTLQ